MLGRFMDTTQINEKKNYAFPLFLIGVLFFIFGFITWSNSQLIPYLKIACELTTAQSYLVATAFFAAYFVMAIPSSYILNRTGYKKGMSLGLFAMAAGALLFIPAAEARSYPMFLAGLFIIGTGLALLQTASNPYVAILGPMDSAATRISIMGICNKIAGIIAVFVLGSIVLKDADVLIERLKTLAPAQKVAELNQLALKVVIPYAIIAAILISVAIIMLFVKLPEVVEEESIKEVGTDEIKTSILQFPHLLLGAIAIFFYVGVEVISYDTFAGYGQSLGYSLETAKHFATYTGYCLVAGYLLGIFLVPKYVSQKKALIAYTMLSMILIFVSISTQGTIAIVSFALLGFSNAIIWPAIWPMAINGLGGFTKIGAALLVMGIVGGAVLPPIYGAIAERIHNPQQAYLLMIPCYLYLLFFAVKGYKVGLKPSLKSAVE